MVYSLIFWALASVCNACMDTLAHHYYKSIFIKRGNPFDIPWNNFWNPETSWNNSYIIPGTKWKLDAWHSFKSLMIIFEALAIMFAWIDCPPFIDSIWFNLGFLIVIGCIWNLTFNVFYNKLLIRK
ncbi:hypothetical protein [uncultured Clostridium sp.]|uniref:hypothetical protein n=1 Tax=uncultured Clostridium sp. TaxID=59620 RepID=UPI002610D6BA|nr:hypothetical protein [uncultured Clostridium sp.]